MAYKDKGDNYVYLSNFIARLKEYKKKLMKKSKIYTIILGVLVMTLFVINSLVDVNAMNNVKGWMTYYITLKETEEKESIYDDNLFFERNL